LRVEGIQGKDHMGNLEAICGIKQAHDDKSGTVDSMPFQIQEPESSGEDRRLPYLKYFL
jgi:hypothetical protein